jgi:hypothetical protein
MLVKKPLEKGREGDDRMTLSWIVMDIGCDDGRWLELAHGRAFAVVRGM